MNNWLNNLGVWFKAHNISAHTVGAGIVAFALAYNGSPEIRNYIATVFTGYPVVVTRFGVLMVDIATGVMLWRNYSAAHSAAGVLAEARKINGKPDAPTASQVDAATTKQ